MFIFLHTKTALVTLFSFALWLDMLRAAENQSGKSHDALLQGSMKGGVLSGFCKIQTFKVKFTITPFPLKCKEFTSSIFITTIHTEKENSILLQFTQKKKTGFLKSINTNY